VYIRDYFLLPLSSVVLNSSLLPDSLVFPTPRSVHMVYGRDKIFLSRESCQSLNVSNGGYSIWIESGCSTSRTYGVVLAPVPVL
jgi:hypothetical protein